MRLPRKITICGKRYTVRRNRRLLEGSGGGKLSTRTLEVGSKSGDSVRAFETFIHEIVELALVENYFRYNRDGDNGFFYKLDHSELTRLTSDIAVALWPMLSGGRKTRPD